MPQIEDENIPRVETSDLGDQFELAYERELEKLGDEKNEY